MKQRFNFWLDDSQLSALKQRAKETSESVTALINSFIADGLAKKQSEESEMEELRSDIQEVDRRIKQLEKSVKQLESY